MDISKTARMAKQFGINLETAVNWRKNYLSDEINLLVEDGSDVALFWAEEAMREINFLENYTEPRKAEIGDIEIEVARNVPIQQIITFRNGKAIAFCHNDTNPSLHFGDKTNRAICYVCDKKFNPIDVLMERDGMAFVDAVKFLNGLPNGN